MARRLPKYKKAHIPAIRKVSQTLNRIAKQTAFDVITTFAEERCATFKQRILDQDFKSFETTPLTDQYLARKASANVDLRTMIATHHYIDNIKVLTRRDDDGSITIYIGFNRRTLARNLKGETVQFALYEVAYVQENGSEKAHIPPRPHWKPELDRIRAASPKVRRRIEKIVTKATRQELVKLLKTG